MARRLERLSPPLPGVASGAPGESWRLLRQPDLTWIENKSSILALGAGSGRLYSKVGGGVQQHGRAGTNTSQAGGFGEGRMKAERGGGIANGGACAQDPRAHHGWGCCKHRLAVEATPQQLGTPGRSERSVQRSWHCQAGETPKEQGGHGRQRPLSSVSHSARARSPWGAAGQKAPSPALGPRRGVLDPGFLQ